MEWKWGETATAFGGSLTLAKVLGLIDSDAKEPGLKPARAMERVDLMHGRNERFLAEILDIFRGEIESELSDEPSRCGIMTLDERFPRSEGSASTSAEHCGFVS